jgi:hypothetical protein
MQKINKKLILVSLIFFTGVISIYLIYKKECMVGGIVGSWGLVNGGGTSV